ncbi:MAG: YceI family protein [Minicystis sp.]
MTIRSSSRVLASGALLAALTFSLIAAAKLNRTDSASAGFHASGPVGMNIDGTTSDVTVTDDGSSVTIVVRLSNLSTGMSLRDKHAKEHLEVDSFPTAELKVARSAIKFPAAGAESSGDAKGSLKIHGQTKDVTFHYTAKLDGDTYGVKGNAAVNINDFGIKTPSYLGVSVKPDITVNVQFQAKDN